MNKIIKCKKNKNVLLTNQTKTPTSRDSLTIITKVQWWYIGYNRQTALQYLAAPSTKSVSTEIQLHIIHCIVWSNTKQYAPDTPQINTSAFTYSVLLKSNKFKQAHAASAKWISLKL